MEEIGIKIPILIPISFQVLQIREKSNEFKNAKSKDLTLKRLETAYFLFSTERREKYSSNHLIDSRNYFFLIIQYPYNTTKNRMKKNH